MSRINNPAHYGGASNPYEAIKVIDAWRCNFNTGNAYKYMARAGLKETTALSLEEKLIEDLGKARWYLDHQLQRMHLGCTTALQRQPLIMPSEYHFPMVFVAVGFAAGLEDAVRACYEQTTAHRVEAGITALDAHIERLTHG